MSGEKRISLNDPVLLSRLRGDFSPKTYNKRSAKIEHRIVQDVIPSTINITKKINNSKNWRPHQEEKKSKLDLISEKPKPPLSLLKYLASENITIDPISVIIKDLAPKKNHKRKKGKVLRIDRALSGLALILFISGIYIAYNGLKDVHISKIQAQKLTAEANQAFSSKKDSNAIATVKPSTQTISNYIVPANNPRLITINKLGVHARIFNVGTDKNGALIAPNNIYDTGWYNQSALPGQPGAMLIDGHLSSWTSNGVFYGLNKLNSGDTLTVEAGNGTLYKYQVVQTKIYSTSNVDMVAAITPFVSGTPGLNLISCYGKVDPGTNSFDQRIIVFTKQIIN